MAKRFLSRLNSRSRSVNRLESYKIITAVLTLIVITQTVIIFRLLPKKVEREPSRARPVSKVLGQIAIVLDDWGYSTNNVDLLRQMPYALTVSILPGLPFSQYVAIEAKRKGFEVILHLPLEPFEYNGMSLEPDTITTDMDSERIVEILRRDIKSIPHLVGASNHMGSKATGDAAVMRTILEELGRGGLYFFDSLVSKNSICQELSGKINVKFAKRDIFLDNKKDHVYIKGQMNKLKKMAAERGYAIGVGHDRKDTLEVLKELMPQFEKEGFSFVLLSQLIR